VGPSPDRSPRAGGWDVTELEAALRDAIAKVCSLDASEIWREATLADLGIDSLSAAEVLIEIEIALQRELPLHVLRDLDRARTVGDIADQLEAALGSEQSRDVP
jgi:acyl carrier protein